MGEGGKRRNGFVCGRVANACAQAQKCGWGRECSHDGAVSAHDTHGMSGAANSGNAHASGATNVCDACGNAIGHIPVVGRGPQVGDL